MNFIKNIQKYFQGAVHELRLVQWPTYNHAVRICIITVIFVLASSLTIFGMDLLLNQVNKGVHGTAELPASNTPQEFQITPEDFQIEATGADGLPVEINLGEDNTVTVDEAAHSEANEIADINIDAPAAEEAPTTEPGV